MTCKWQSNKNFKPTRDFNADDVIFSFERQWKDSNPYHKVSGGGYDYFNDMELPELLAAIDKVDDYTVRFTLDAAAGAVPRRHGDGFRRDPVEGIRRCAAQARQARADRPGADRHRAVQLAAVPEGRHHPLQAPSTATGAGSRRSTRWCSPSTRTRRCAWPSCARMSARSRRIPSPADLPKIKCRPEPAAAVAARAEHRLSRVQRTKTPFTDKRVRERDQHGDRQEGDPRRGLPGLRPAGEEPDPADDVVLQRRGAGLPIRSGAAKKLLAEAGFPDGFETDLWAMPVQRPYNPDARRIAELMQSDLAKVGIKAKIVSYEWGEYRKRVQNGEHRWRSWAGPATTATPTISSSRSPAARRRARAAAAPRNGATRQFDELVEEGGARSPTRPSAPSSTSRRR